MAFALTSGNLFSQQFASTGIEVNFGINSINPVATLTNVTTYMESDDFNSLGISAGLYQVNTNGFDSTTHSIAFLGAKNPRFWCSVSGGGVQKAYYSIEFDSHEDYGKWQDAMMESEFWPEFQKFINEGYPDIEYISTDIYYSMI